MEKIRRKLIIEDFVQTTTFHGVFYVNSVNKWVKLIWLFTVIISALLIIISTVLMVNKYLRYESYIITEENDVDKLEELPNLLVCSSYKQAIVDSILEYDPKMSEAYKRNFSELSSVLVDDIYMDQIKQSVIKARRYSLASCNINIKNQVINCNEYKHDILFTFKGFCLLMSFQEIKQNNASLLHKSNNLLNNRINEAKIEVKFNSLKKEDYLYFQLDAVYNHSNIVFKHLNNVLVFNNYGLGNLYYDVTPTYTQYSSSLSDKKCFHKNEETSCHFKCLQQILAEEVKCFFTFNPIKNEKHEHGLPYCSLSQLVDVEHVIQDYSHYRSQYKMCDQCLPNCKSLKFEMNKDLKENNVETKEFVWNFNLKYKIKQIKHIELFAYTDLLNFINGLWSILLGISVLSIWEIIELSCGLLRRSNYFRKVNSLSTDIQKKEPITVKSAFQSVFHDTYLHGLKSILNDNYSKSVKLRWFTVIILATIGFSIAINDATNEYLKYNSNIVKTEKYISKDGSLINRKYELLVCAPLVLVNQSQKVIYMELDKKAEDLFAGNFSDIKHIIGEYKMHMKYNNMLEENIIQLYDRIYSRIKLRSFFRLDYDTKLQLHSLNYYFDKVCMRLQINETLKERVGNIYFITLNIKEIEKILSIYPVYQMNVFILDSESFHISEKSWFKSFSSLNPKITSLVRANFKQKQLLPSPFRPSCNQKKDYKQHECHQKCFNDIIFKVFGCKVIFDEPLNGSTYCHPWMLPLIINYEKLVLRNSHAYNCDHCKEPCDFFYYKTEYVEQKGSSGIVLKLIDNFELTKQKQILLFEDTLVIAISYFSLFYGASILALIQIFYNMILSATSHFFKASPKKEFNFFKKLAFLDLFSNSTTIHCANYISSKNRNDIKKLFWLILILLTFFASIAYCVAKVWDYQRSKPVNLTIELNDKHAESFMVDICERVDDTVIAGDNGIESTYDSFKNIIEAMKFKEIKEFPNLNKFLAFYLDEFKAALNKSKEKYGELFEIRVSSLVNNTANSYFNSVYISNGIEWKMNTLIKLLDYNFSTNIYETGLIYDRDAYMNIDICQTVNLTLLQKNANKYSLHNPFINHPKNQLSLYYRSKYLNDLFIYFEKQQIESFNDYSYTRIKSIYKKHDFKYECSIRDNCVSKYNVLGEISEHQLFFCNSKLRDAVYTVFNCTPFMTQTKYKQECSMAYATLITYIMQLFKKTLFKCEFSSTKSAIEFDDFSIPRNLISTNKKLFMSAINFNGVKVYEQKIVEDYDLLQLVIDLSNWLNVLIGFSFITIIELLFLFFYQKLLKKQ